MVIGYMVRACGRACVSVCMRLRVSITILILYRFWVLIHSGAGVIVYGTHTCKQSLSNPDSDIAI